jgi:1-acyl-sn-glycerol-3-phosphate acyltransferase
LHQDLRDFYLFMNYPKYSYPPGLFARAAWDLILLRRRDLRRDAKACIENMSAELKVFGEENIPRQGGCVLTINHFHRPGLGAQWIALAVTALVPLPIRWAVTGELMCQGKWYRAVGTRASRVFLRRLAYLYGLITMPPMPPRPTDVKARATSVRAILKHVKQGHEPVLGISPEGYNSPQGALTRPATGFGRFALLLSRAGMKFVPVGGYEADGVFHLHFGNAYELSIPGDFSTDEKDEQAIQMIMRKIACLLPTHLQGEFA